MKLSILVVLLPPTFYAWNSEAIFFAKVFELAQISRLKFFVFYLKKNVFCFNKTICQSFIKAPHLDILLIGIHRNSLVIIDRNFLVYELPLTIFRALDFTISFEKILAKTTIEKRWPSNRKNWMQDFQHKKNVIELGWIWSEYNLTFAYRISRNKSVQFGSIDSSLNNRWISNVSIHKEFHKFFKKKRNFCFMSNSDPEPNHLLVFKLEDGNLMMSQYDPIQWYYLCSDDKNRETITKPVSIGVFLSRIKCERSIFTELFKSKQNLLHCFQSESQLFLITSALVFHVSHLITQQSRSNETFLMRRRKMNEFFQCNHILIDWIENQGNQ